MDRSYIYIYNTTVLNVTTYSTVTWHFFAKSTGW